jgi:uncharacterized protein YggU (UPF0235/DUF167 family)
MPLRLSVEARPGKKIPSLTVRDGVVVVAVRERAIDGAANEAVRRAIAAWLGVSIGCVSIVRGANARRKRVELIDVDPEYVAGRIASCTEERARSDSGQNRDEP